MPDLAPQTARLVIQSDRRMVREALAAYFDGRRGFTVVGHTATGQGLQTLCELGRPDVALIDVSMLTAGMVRALREIRSAFPRVDLVVAYTSLSLDLMADAVRAGVTSFVPSSRGLDAVVRTLRQRAQQARAGHPAPDAQALTDRELAIISLLGSGHTASDIARLLQISPHTVDNHKRRVYAKFGVGSQSQVVSHATALGLVDAPRPASANPCRTELGRAPLAVVCGTAGAGLDDVLHTLTVRGVPFVHFRTPSAAHHDHWAQWQRGPIIAVLVDPTGPDWIVPASLEAAAVVVRGAAPERSMLATALGAGARGLLYGDTVATDLAEVLWLVARGYFAISSRHAEDLTGALAGGGQDQPRGAPRLTAREVEILDLMAAGHTIRQAARTLGIAAKTVENTQQRLYHKLGTHNRAETLAVAYRLGLLEDH